MKKIMITIFVCLLFLGCQTGGHWTANELGEWYVELKQNNPRLLSPLYYQGTDNNFHYFVCRSIDTWVPVKVDKEEIEMEDIRPYLSVSQSKNFPGYFVVDPEYDFKKINDTKQ